MLSIGKRHKLSGLAGAILEPLEASRGGTARLGRWEFALAAVLWMVGGGQLKGYDASRSRRSFTFPSGNTAYISSRPPIASTKFSSVLR
jgi:hypothetical protein